MQGKKRKPRGKRERKPKMLNNKSKLSPEELSEMVRDTLMNQMNDRKIPCDDENRIRLAAAAYKFAVELASSVGLPEDRLKFVGEHFCVAAPEEILSRMLWGVLNKHKELPVS